MTRPPSEIGHGMNIETKYLDKLKAERERLIKGTPKESAHTLAERERCAKIAEEWTTEFDKATGGFAHSKFQAVRSKCGQAIAAATQERQVKWPWRCEWCDAPLHKCVCCKSSPDPQPVESPVTIGSKSGPHVTITQQMTYAEARERYPDKVSELNSLESLAKSPNTPRESRAVENAGERTEGKS